MMSVPGTFKTRVLQAIPFIPDIVGKQIDCLCRTPLLSSYIPKTAVMKQEYIFSAILSVLQA
jgi:hypothetical protein